MVKNPFKTGDADSIYGQGTKISLTTEQLEKLKGRPTLSKKKEKENPSSVPIHSVQFSSVAQSCPTLWDPMVTRQAFLFFTISRSLLKLTSIESVMPSNHLILCRPLLLLPPTFPSIRVFSSESALRIRWPKDWSFSFSI